MRQKLDLVRQAETTTMALLNDVEWGLDQSGLDMVVALGTLEV